MKFRSRTFSTRSLYILQLCIVCTLLVPILGTTGCVERIPTINSFDLKDAAEDILRSGDQKRRDQAIDAAETAALEAELAAESCDDSCPEGEALCEEAKEAAAQARRLAESASRARTTEAAENRAKQAQEAAERAKKSADEADEACADEPPAKEPEEEEEGGEQRTRRQEAEGNETVVDVIVTSFQTGFLDCNTDLSQIDKRYPEASFAGSCTVDQEPESITIGVTPTTHKGNRFVVFNGISDSSKAFGHYIKPGENGDEMVVGFRMDSQEDRIDLCLLVGNFATGSDLLESADLSYCYGVLTDYYDITE